MRGLIRLIAACLALVSVTDAAHAEWLEASSKHFIVYGNISRKQMTIFTDRMERFGGAMRYLFQLPEPEGGTANRVAIYLVPNTEAVRHLAGAPDSNIAGFYRTRAEGSFIVTPANISIGNDHFNPGYILFHEYAHHLLLGNTHVIYPSWVSEGLAEYFSTAAITPDGTVGFGAADNARVYSLRVAHPMSVEMLLNTDRSLSDGQATAQKYSRGWLLTHYLLTKPARTGQFRQFLNLINDGTPALDAGKRAFGDLNALNRELDVYLNTRLAGYVIAPDKYTVDPVTIRTMTPAEAAMMPLRVESVAGVNDKEAQKLLPDARKIAIDNPGNAWIQGVMAEMEFDARNDAEAEAACDKALVADPRNLMATVFKARIHLRRAAKAKSADPAAWREARDWILKANRIEPNYALPLVMFYKSFKSAHEKPRASAVSGLIRAVELAPQDNRLRALAFSELLDEGELPLARQILAPVAFDAHANGDNPVRAVIDLIDSGATIAAVREAAAKVKLIRDASL